MQGHDVLFEHAQFLSPLGIKNNTEIIQINSENAQRKTEIKVNMN